MPAIICGHRSRPGYVERSHHAGSRSTLKKSLAPLTFTMMRFPCLAKSSDAGHYLWPSFSPWLRRTESSRWLKINIEKKPSPTYFHDDEVSMFGQKFRCRPLFVAIVLALVTSNGVITLAQDQH